jgi:hypothetical protein
MSALRNCARFESHVNDLLGQLDEAQEQRACAIWSTFISACAPRMRRLCSMA